MFCTHKITKANALHVAVERRHTQIVQMMVASAYPLDLVRDGGLTALIIGSRDRESVKICEELIVGGANIDINTPSGASALSEAVKAENVALVEILLKS